MGKFNFISMEEARKLALEEGYIVVDLRGTQDYYKSHIDNAINIPSADVSQILEFGKKEYTWILYCRRGSFSFKLASELSDYGYKALAVVGGYRE
ncbi:MAG: rhodanese-like domain-containing protein [Eubacterium sp.]|nr:rhodanese-like domain-containing protein [Eubacterium sp.]